uniref:L1 transposable element RRM domain-containing protein n=1 Tax=Acanthochromis polyacanthus TaxID=80966 RepID=A0A3Q1EIL4_9TELE
MDRVLAQLDEAERRVSELEDNRQLRQSADKSIKKMRGTSIEDAANRDRRQNLRLVGLKEKMENGKIEICVRNIIAEALGVELDPVQLQRVHRTPVPMLEDNNPPRQIIMRKKESVIWKGCKLSFFPDMTSETAEKRKKFTDARRRLHELDVCFTLAYPAELRLTWRGKRVKFTDDRQAMAFLNNDEEVTTEELQ